MNLYASKDKSQNVDFSNNNLQKYDTKKHWIKKVYNITFESLIIFVTN